MTPHMTAGKIRGRDAPVTDIGSLGLWPGEGVGHHLPSGLMQPGVPDTAEVNVFSPFWVKHPGCGRSRWRLRRSGRACRRQ